MTRLFIIGTPSWLVGDWTVDSRSFQIMETPVFSTRRASIEDLVAQGWGGFEGTVVISERDGAMFPAEL